MTFKQSEDRFCEIVHKTQDSRRVSGSSTSRMFVQGTQKRFVWIAAVAFIFVGVSVLVSSAQTAATAWFGLPSPGPATEQVIDFTHLDIPRIAAPDASGAPELEGGKLVQYVKDIVQFSYASRAAGEKLWGRLAGSPYTDQTVEYVAKEWRGAGLTVNELPVPFVRNNHPVAWHVRLLAAPEFGAGTEPIELASAVPMGVAAPGGRGGPDEQGAPTAAGEHKVTAQLVYVGDASPTALSLTDVKGKIAIFVIEPAPGAFYSDALRQGPQALARAGAAGAIGIYDLPGNLQLSFGSCSQQMMCFTVGGEDGSFLRAVIERAAAVKVLDKLQAELSVTRSGPENLVAHALVAKIAGRDSSENIVLSTHSDSYFAGANDNASGVAGLIGLAKYYARAAKPQHDLYFFLSPGHHSATGATTSLIKHDPLIPKNNIVLLNLEHIGQAGVYRSYTHASVDKYGRRTDQYVPTNWDSQGREVTMGPDSIAIKNAWAESAAREQFTGPALIYPSPLAELAPFVAAGGAGIQDVETSPWYHTSGDTVETISPEAMQRVALFYKDFIDSVDKLSRAKVREGIDAHSSTP
jgi:Peptidase family M28